MTGPVFRFAPSPNGELHLGHAYSALLNARMAKARGGRFLLRIEDIDEARCTPEFEAAIYRDLEWLGLEWETPVRRQSDHLAEYRKQLDWLVKEELAYPTFMTRSQIRDRMTALQAAGRRWPHDPDGAPLYPGDDRRMSRSERKRRMSSGEPFAWRLNTSAALDRLSPVQRSEGWKNLVDERGDETERVEPSPTRWGDVVIARKDVPTSYHLSVVTDDAAQGITHVVRGQDLLAATDIHWLLQMLFGLPRLVYLHHGLIPGPDGRKLSKSFRDSGLRALREAGRTPADIRRMVGLD